MLLRLQTTVCRKVLDQTKIESRVKITPGLSALSNVSDWLALKRFALMNLQEKVSFLHKELSLRALHRIHHLKQNAARHILP